MKRFCSFLLALVLLTGVAAAAEPDALGLYTPLKEEQVQAEQAAARAVLELLIEEDMTDGEKATVLHDWIVLNCRYNATLYRDMSYGVLVEHQAVCRGYARAYVALAELLGFACDYSFSPALEHAWALVELDGSYYCVDPTWDDNHCERIGFVNHRHFFFTSATEQLFGHYGGDSAIRAAGGIYEAAPWRAAVSRVIFEGDYAYYLNGAFQLIRCRRDNWQTEVLFDREEVWPGFYELDGSPALATGLVLMRNRFWFNTPTAICSVDLEGGDLRVEFEPEDPAAGWLCGIDIREGRLVYTQSAVQDQLFVEVQDAGISGWGAWGYEPVEAENPWNRLKLWLSGLAAKESE